MTTGCVPNVHPEAEWLEADGLGGFASGTVSGIRTRRYHAWLLAAATPPTDRVLLVNGGEVAVSRGGMSHALSSQRYVPDVVHPDGATRIESFATEPWPRWVFRLPDGARVEHELFVRHDLPLVALSWRIAGADPYGTLVVRPLLSARDPHELRHESSEFRFDAELEGDRTTWRPYPNVPGIVTLANGRYGHAPDWYRRFQYDEERARGLDFVEDLAAPGAFQFDLARGEAVMLLAADSEATRACLDLAPPLSLLDRLRKAEHRRRSFGSRLERAADAYIVRRDKGRTIIAGYPWFTDWGRDTFIALRGLCLAGDRLDDARGILTEWAGAVSEGMLPNRFVEQGDAPEYNSVDASLWYVIAVHDFLGAAARARHRVPASDRGRMERAIDEIVAGYARGTRFGIRMDDDGLLACGVPGVQLTWMDAKVDDWVVTPRIGKPVEIQALWLNALRIVAARDPRWREPLVRGLASFHARFWNEDRGCLYDVVDVDHRRGAMDDALRPNQLFAVGGLPFALLEGERAEQVVEAAELWLWTPMGPRSLGPGEPDYHPRYEGDRVARDGGYHQGTVWPWLTGPFVEAWVRVRGDTTRARREARRRFVEPLLRHLDEAGLGHVSEVADAEAPHVPRACPFQAWSVGELLRLERHVLGDESPGRSADNLGIDRPLIDSRPRRRTTATRRRPGARPGADRAAEGR